MSRLCSMCDVYRVKNSLWSDIDNSRKLFSGNSIKKEIHKSFIMLVFSLSLGVRQTNFFKLIKILLMLVVSIQINMFMINWFFAFHSCFMLFHHKKNIKKKMFYINLIAVQTTARETISSVNSLLILGERARTHTFHQNCISLLRSSLDSSARDMWWLCIREARILVKRRGNSFTQIMYKQFFFVQCD